MSRLLHYLQSLFGPRGIVEDDHLTGAIDLSDVPYCMGLLAGSDDR
jgi:hypothetical protein